MSSIVVIILLLKTAPIILLLFLVVALKNASEYERPPPHHQKTRDRPVSFFCSKLGRNGKKGMETENGLGKGENERIARTKNTPVCFFERHATDRHNSLRRSLGRTSPTHHTYTDTRIRPRDQSRHPSHVTKRKGDTIRCEVSRKHQFSTRAI